MKDKILYEIMDKLIVLIRKENGFLRELKTAEACKLYHEKEDLLNRYHFMLQWAHSNREEFNNTFRRQKHVLLEKNRELDELGVENEKLLKKITASHERILNTINRQVNKEISPAKSYSQMGVMNVNKKFYGGAATSLTVNTSL